MSAPTSYTQSQDHTSLWLQLLLRISVFAGWFSTRVREYVRLKQETRLEEAEERRLLALRKSGQQQTQSSTPQLTFPQFGRLPPELRQQIWVEALPDARVLMLQPPKPTTLAHDLLAAIRPRSHRHQHRRRQSNVWTCHARLPSLLQVNSEARAVALRHYRLGLAPGSSEPRIYVDLERDVIALSNELMRSPAGRNLWRLTEDLGKARHVALAGGVAVSFLDSRLLSRRSGRLLASAQHVAVVESALWGRGIVPRVAELDWPHWMRWQVARGKAHWNLGGVDEEDREEGKGVKARY